MFINSLCISQLGYLLAKGETCPIMNRGDVRESEHNRMGLSVANR